MSNFKPLKRSSLILFHRHQGKIVKGANKKMTYFSGLTGNFTGLRGDCTGLTGDCTGLTGDCTGLLGYCTGLLGYCTGLTGDIHVFVQE